MVTSLTKITVAVVHASLAVGAVNDGVPVHSIVILAPCPPIVGGVVSATVIVCDVVAELLPQASTAIHFLVNVFAQTVPPVISAPACTTVYVLHASDAVGAVND